MLGIKLLPFCKLFYGCFCRSWRLPLSLSFMSYLVVMTISFLFALENLNLLNYFSFLKNVFTHTAVLFGSLFFFHYFKYIVSFPSGLQDLWEICLWSYRSSLVYDESLFFCCFQHFPFVGDIWMFDNNVSLCGFILGGIYWACWIWLFLSSKLNFFVFLQRKLFVPLSLFSFCDSHDMYFGLLIVFHESLSFSLLFFILFPFCSPDSIITIDCWDFLLLDYFSNSLVNLFNSVITFLSSKISVWLFLTILFVNILILFIHYFS